MDLAVVIAEIDALEAAEIERQRWSLAPLRRIAEMLAASPDELSQPFVRLSKDRGNRHGGTAVAELSFPFGMRTELRIGCSLWGLWVEAWLRHEEHAEWRVERSTSWEFDLSEEMTAMHYALLALKRVSQRR